MEMKITQWASCAALRRSYNEKLLKFAFSWCFFADLNILGELVMSISPGAFLGCKADQGVHKYLTVPVRPSKHQ